MRTNRGTPEQDATSRTLQILADMDPADRAKLHFDPGLHMGKTVEDMVQGLITDSLLTLEVPPDRLAEVIAQHAATLPPPPEAATLPPPPPSKRAEPSEREPAEPTTMVAENSDNDSSEPEATAEDDDNDEDGRDDPRDENTWLQVCDKLDAMLNQGGWDCLDDTFQFVRDWLKRTAKFAKEDPDTLRVLNVVKKLPAKNRAELAKAMESGTLAYLIGPEKGSQTQADAIESGERAIRELYGLSYRVDGAYFSLRSIEDSKDPKEREVGMNAATEIIEAMGITVRDELETCERALGDLSRIISSYERQAEE